ncbi:hypothetical protein [Sediminispirochaeta smaragdinae]|uniref:Uncharacterized protein n=1 Tax=Sediminispirochaeta smaragdinae (strain DSM 11293 / JCM 15392 / SEBR 4228) TaxID=573413 RepID=E1R3J3_SEDSS|nr:hypothetical protein [Sediminispirochaeta smaragdinae]ADK81624.1 hypothetical protein Spirs_2511 [Sediminispirochaeta smaragdinae DSM 11293]
MQWNSKTFMAMLQQYYGRLSPIHAGALGDWLADKQLSGDYLMRLYQEITESYSTKYGRPCDLAIVKEADERLYPHYFPPANLLEGDGKMIEERVAEREEAAQFMHNLIENLVKKKRRVKPVKKSRRVRNDINR